MAKRDPEKTARNRIIKDLSNKLDNMLPKVLSDTGIKNIYSLNGMYGSKHAEYIDIKHVVVTSPDHFVTLYFEGFRETAKKRGANSRHYKNLQLVKDYDSLREYLFLFLKRTYYKHYDALSKIRPNTDEASVWIGQNNADYGILVTPRFNTSIGQWENDKSEIRHFKPRYWSIGHILETGLCVPGRERRQKFHDVDEYLNFFKDVLVRNSGSQYEAELADIYSRYVRSHQNQLDIPMLIPEFRYGGLEKKHIYRLDFCIFEPQNMIKIGIELSPWSTHGKLSKIKKLTQKKVNEKASDNFEKEMQKHKEYFFNHDVFVLIYTDSDLADMGGVFETIRIYLEPQVLVNRLSHQIVAEMLGL